MSNTHCKNCMFSQSTESTDPCDFGIIDIIKGHKELSVIDNYFYIKDYKCSYGFSENIYNDNPELQKTNDIKTFILDKAKISYYLVMDCRLLSIRDLLLKVETVKNLDIKPKFISIIISNEQNIKRTIDCVHKSLSGSSVDWKIHSFLNSASFNDCINILAETTIKNLDNTQFILFDEGSEYSKNINSMINYLQYSFKIMQSKNYCIALELDNLNMMCLYISLYKSIISTISRNILEGINSVPNLNIGFYDIKQSQ